MSSPTGMLSNLSSGRWGASTAGGASQSPETGEGARLSQMTKLTAAQLTQVLSRMLTPAVKIMTPVMMWGQSGIGKSSIVKRVAADHGMPVIDLRLSQLAPTDLRGLPVAKDGRSTWYPPEFLPRATDPEGVLFLDEINMAPPAMQAICQQLILDRCVGTYQLPSGWRIWAAGNRKEDRAAVYDMPAPVANRMLHVEVTVDWESFKTYALEHRMHDALLGFLAHDEGHSRLHKMDPNHPAWPSPRTWMFANELFQKGLPIALAVGETMANEFRAYLDLYAQLPQVERVLAGHGGEVTWPTEAHLCYVTVMALIVRAKTEDEAANAVAWLTQAADRPREWVVRFLTDYVPLAEKREALGTFVTALQRFPHARTAFDAYAATVAQASA